MGKPHRPHGLRFPPPLRDGLTVDERLAKVETRVFGTDRVPGLDRDHDTTRRRVEDLESAQRRHDLPWYLRLLLRWKP